MEKRKSHNYYKEIIFGALGVFGVVINFLGIYFTHLLGIGFGFYVLSMVKKDKEYGLEYSKLGYLLGWLSLLLGIAAIAYGAAMGVQNV